MIIPPSGTMHEVCEAALAEMTQERDGWKEAALAASSEIEEAQQEQDAQEQRAIQATDRAFAAERSRDEVRDLLADVLRAHAQGKAFDFEIRVRIARAMATERGRR